MELLRHLIESSARFISLISGFLRGITGRMRRADKKASGTKVPPENMPLPTPHDHEDDRISKQDQAHPCASYTRLKLQFRDIGRENGIIEILGRDFLTAMPAGAYASRLGQIAYLFRRVHEDLTSEDISQLLSEAKAHEFTHPDEWDEWDLANLREMERLYRNFCHVDPSLIEWRARLSYEGRKRHVQVLADNDWDQARDFLQEQIELHRRIADARCRALNETSAYQTLVWEYMPHISIADMGRWFASFSSDLDELLPEIMARQAERPEPLPLGGRYKGSSQMLLNRALLSMIGFDFDRGGLYETGHNPVEGGTPDDTRLVIKAADENNFLASMKSALHEGGHGLYIQGLPRKEWRYQPVAMDWGAAMHESQALVIDMILGRMYEFFEYLSPRAEGLFHAIGDPALSPGNLYALRTRVQPVTNRRHADEVTYFRHIQMRMELERKLIDGTLSVDDLPEAWMEAAQKYTGTRPLSYADGCLQDVHWFVGKFGYFPSYAMGLMLAAQQYHAMQREIEDIPSLVRSGNFAPFRQWLNRNIHSKGRLKPWDELIEDATGKSLDPSFLTAHMKERYLQ